MLQQILVTAAVIGKQRQILLAQRLPRGQEGGKWEFPGGKVEWGEEPRHCLARELAEELGVNAAVAEILDEISVVAGERQLVLLYFAARIESGTPRAVDCQKVAWFSPDEIDCLDKPEADRIFWERNQEMIREHLSIIRSQ